MRMPLSLQRMRSSPRRRGPHLTSLLLLLILALAPPAGAQELMGLRLGEHRLSDALARVGNTPLVQGREGVDSLCYRAEVPFEETWVVLSSGAAGNWDVLTTFRVLSSPPAGMSCRPTPLVNSTIAVEGIRKGMSEDELRAWFNLPAGTYTTSLVLRLRPRAQFRGAMESGRLVSFEVTLE
jgi:hypothetical protein